MAKYAVLFAGCVDSSGWRQRYNNDLAFMHTILVRNGYQVITLYYNGMDLKLGDIIVKTLPCTLSFYNRVISNFKKNLSEDDNLLFFVSNHGGYSISENMAFINCLGNEYLFQDKFENDMNSINANKVIILGQCYGGNFISCDIDNSIIMSANKPGEVSFACPNNLFDEFLYHFMAYLWGAYPDGSALNTPRVLPSDMQDAFIYARNNNYYYCNPGKCNYPDSEGNLLPMFEEPQIKINVNTKVLL